MKREVTGIQDVSGALGIAIAYPSSAESIGFTQLFLVSIQLCIALIVFLPISIVDVLWNK